MKAYCCLVAMLLTYNMAFAAPADSLDTAHIEQLTGAQGKPDDNGRIFKVSLPRDDLHVSVGGVPIVPTLGVTSWAAFTRAGGHDMVMGDIVVTEDSANAVLDAALKNGLEVTALHNHFFGDSPRIMYMHISGMGDEGQLAKAVGAAFQASKQTAPRPTAHIDTAHSNLDARSLDGILNEHGAVDSGVYKVTVGRTTSMYGESVGKAMGVNTWAAFAGTDANALVDGDFVMKENELQPVLKALRGAGIQIVAIHNHMVGESPRMMFLHYWGTGKAADLARGVRSALDVTSTQ